MEGKKYLHASSNNENPFGDEEFLNLVFGEVSSQFHTQDESEMISNPQNERERHFYGKFMMDEFWLDREKQSDEYLEVMKTEFQKMISNLIKHFTEKKW